MAKVKNRTIYVCQNCGAQRPRWEGRCTECGTWNSLVEETMPGNESRAGSTKSSGKLTSISLEKAGPVQGEVQRYKSGIGELDRVLGGGLVPGSFVLLGG